MHLPALVFARLGLPLLVLAYLHSFVLAFIDLDLPELICIRLGSLDFVCACLCLPMLPLLLLVPLAAIHTYSSHISIR
jgi:hypothetical protein